MSARRRTHPVSNETMLSAELDPTLQHAFDNYSGRNKRLRRENRSTDNGTKANDNGHLEQLPSQPPDMTHIGDENEDNYMQSLLPNETVTHTRGDEGSDNTSIDDGHAPTDMRTASEQSHPPNTAVLNILRTGLKYAASWENLLSFLSVTGRTRFSRQLYTILREAMLASSQSKSKLLSYSTARSRQVAYFNEHCFPKAKVFSIPCAALPETLRSAPSMLRTAVGDLRDVRECVKIVLPSAWAKFDLSMHATYADIIDGSHHEDKSQISIERSPIVSNREHFTGTSQSFWALYNGSIVNVDIGTAVSIPVHDEIPQRKEFQCWDVTMSVDGHHHVHCHTGPQWCVSTQSYNSHRRTEVEPSLLSPDERSVYKVLRNSCRSLQDMQSEQHSRRSKSSVRSRSGHIPNCTMLRQDEVHVFPSDICVFLRPFKEPDDGRSVCILISSFVTNVTGLPSERIVWIDVTSEENQWLFGNIDSSHGVLRYDVTLNVTAVPLVHESNTTTVKVDEERKSAPSGVLADGSRFVTYRFALYADEFGFDGVCGCYLLLLGAAQHNRISSAGVRVLSLVPKHQNVNKVMKLILDDVLIGTLRGIPSTDPYGNKITIFLDMCSVFGDYVKISALTNTAGHSATCFCTFCKTPKHTTTTAPTYAYSTNTHSRRLGFMRCDERMDILTNMPQTEHSRRQLGLKVSLASRASTLPLVSFSNDMVRMKETGMKLASGKSVTSTFFDSTLSTAIAPDHLLTGLISVLLEACFRSLPDKNSRIIIEREILNVARDNSLPTDGQFLRFYSGRFDGIASMTMSTLYVVLLFGSRIFESIKGTELDTKHIFHIPCILQGFVSTLYYWPDISLDPATDIDFVTSNNFRNYQQQLRFYATSYSSEVAKHMRTYGDMAVLTDRPNSHRLLELTVHTVPLFGHGKLTSELILELTHAFFKSWFKQNTHANSHITAVDLFVSRIWSTNVFILYNMWKNGTADEQKLALSNLVTAFFGDIAKQIVQDSRSAEVKELLEEFVHSIDGLIRPPIPRILQGSIPIGFLTESTNWVPKGTRKSEQLQDITSMAITHLSEGLGMSYDDLKQELHFYDRASLTVHGKYNTGSRTYPYKAIYRDIPISCHVAQDDVSNVVIKKLLDGHGIRIQIAVHDIVGHHSNTYVFGCDLVQCYNEHFAADLSRVRVIPLQTGIARLAFIPTDIEEAIAGTRGPVEVGLLGGKQFHILFRQQGYPPCLG